MRRTHFLLIFFLAVAFALGSAQPTRAQDAPKWEIFGGYTYMRANIVVSGTPFNMNGGSGSVAYNPTRWLGLVGDFGVYYQGTVVGNPASLTIFTYQFGPRISWRASKRLTPFAQALVGGGYAGGTLYTSSLGAGAAPLGASNAFTFTVGGGLDVNLNRHVALRLFQAEYLYSQFVNAVDNRQNNLRASAGLVFRFGSH
ncbi:MAG: outer membrane beta-barrel protein [Candidatus Acidiferrales bacterium]